MAEMMWDVLAGTKIPFGSITAELLAGARALSLADMQ